MSLNLSVVFQNNTFNWQSCPLFQHLSFEAHSQYYSDFSLFSFQNISFLGDNLSFSDCNRSHCVISRIGNSWLINLWEEVSRKQKSFWIWCWVTQPNGQPVNNRAEAPKAFLKSFLFVFFFLSDSTYFGKSYNFLGFP